MTFDSAARRRERRERRDRSPMTRLVMGSLLALWGLGLLLDNLGIGSAHEYVNRIWPAALVITGIAFLTRRGAEGHRHGFWGTVFLFAGTCMYAAQHDWFHASLGAVFVPVVVIAVGVSFVYRAFERPRADASPPQLSAQGRG